VQRIVATKPTILLTGLTYFVDQLIGTTFSSSRWRVKTLDLNSIRSLSKRLVALAIALLHVDLWYQINGYAGRGRIYRIAHMLGVPVIIHWVGSDVLSATKYFNDNPQFLKTAKSLIHWAGAPWLVSELRELGIEASFIPLPLKPVGKFLSQNPPKLTTHFTVSSYLSDQRPRFYGWDHILQLAKDFPEIDILIAGAEGRFAKDFPPNIQFLGWIDNMYDMYANSTVLVRMTQHDGYGGTVQEALALGRYAIWSYPFPGALQAKDYSSLCKHIKRLYNLHQKGLLTFNEEGREYMRQNMEPKMLAARIQEGLIGVLNKRG